MKMRMAVIISLLLSIAGCGKKGTTEKTEPIGGDVSPASVTVRQLKELVDSGKDIFLLDVRTEPEFIQGRLTFADARISFDSLNNHLDQLPQDKGTPIYTFCRTGRRSNIAKSSLESIGYTNVFNVVGGITAWQEAGYETVAGQPRK